jgi:nanoRNase/pAp phosphatase (c-di-AMP/oligoRNAs hydrolase)
MPVGSKAFYRDNKDALTRAVYKFLNKMGIRKDEIIDIQYSIVTQDEMMIFYCFLTWWESSDRSKEWDPEE